MMAPHIAVLPFLSLSHAVVLLSFVRSLAAAALAGAALSFLTTVGSVMQLRKAGTLPGCRPLDRP